MLIPLITTGKTHYYDPEIIYPPMAMWFDASDPLKTLESDGLCTSIQCKVTDRIWTPPFTANAPSIDTSGLNLGSRCLSFRRIDQNKYLTGLPIALNPPFTAFLVTSMANQAIFSYSSLGLQTGNNSNALQGATGSPSLFRFKSPPHAGVELHGQGNSSYWYAPAGSGPAVVSLAVPQTNINEVEATFNSVSMEENLQVLGTLPTIWNPTTLGSTDSLYASIGYFGELIVYNSILTPEEIYSKSVQLKNKWDID